MYLHNQFLGRSLEAEKKLLITRKKRKEKNRTLQKRINTW